MCDFSPKNAFYFSQKKKRKYTSSFLSVRAHTHTHTQHTRNTTMACPVRHFLGHFYRFVAFVGALAAMLFGMKDARRVVVAENEKKR